MTETVAWLARLVRHETVSHASNLGLIDEVDAYLKALGFLTERIADPDAPKAGLFAQIGPSGVPGVLWSAHSDVVPTDGQTWTRPAFRMTDEGGRLYGRGTTDMKGFLAAMLAGAGRAARQVPAE